MHYVFTEEEAAVRLEDGITNWYIVRFSVQQGASCLQHYSFFAQAKQIIHEVGVDGSIMQLIRCEFTVRKLKN